MNRRDLSVCIGLLAVAFVYTVVSWFQLSSALSPYRDMPRPLHTADGAVVWPCRGGDLDGKVVASACVIGEQAMEVRIDPKSGVVTPVGPASGWPDAPAGALDVGTFPDGAGGEAMIDSSGLTRVDASGHRVDPLDRGSSLALLYARQASPTSARAAAFIHILFTIIVLAPLLALAHFRQRPEIFFAGVGLYVAAVALTMPAWNQLVG